MSTHLVSSDVCPQSDQISDFTSEMQFHVLPKLNITSYVEPSTIQLPEWMMLADPEFYRTGPVDVIIGAEFYMDLLTDERVKPTADGPTLYNTLFGWILSGRLPGNPPASTSLVSVSVSAASIVESKTDQWKFKRRRLVAAWRRFETRNRMLPDRIVDKEEGQRGSRNNGPAEGRKPPTGEVATRTRL